MPCKSNLSTAAIPNGKCRTLRRNSIWCKYVWHNFWQICWYIFTQQFYHFCWSNSPLVEKSTVYAYAHRHTLNVIKYVFRRMSPLLKQITLDNKYNHNTKGTLSLHDDVIKWKSFPRYWPFVRGIHGQPVNSPHKGQWHGALMFSLICAWINGCANNCEAGDLRRHRPHYDVIVMSLITS